MALPDIVAVVVAVITTFPSLRRVWGMRPVANAEGDLLVVPLLHVPEVNFPLARRLQCWQFSVLLHSITTFWCIWEDHDTTTVRYLAPACLLLCSIAQLGFLLWYYPITEEVFGTGLAICLGSWFYLLLVSTDIVCFEITKISITPEILLMAFTTWMHALRFVAQDSFEFNKGCLFVAVLGCIPGVIAPFSIYELSSKPDMVLLDLLTGHLLFKVSTIINSLFRLLDVVFLSIAATRVIANYLQQRLQECFH